MINRGYSADGTRDTERERGKTNGLVRARVIADHIPCVVTTSLSGKW